jgi:hypothetical protein
MVVRSPTAVVDNRANVVARPTRNRFVQTFQFSPGGGVANWNGPLGSLTLEPGCYLINGTVLIEHFGGDSGPPSGPAVHGDLVAKFTENTMTPWDPAEGPITGQMWWGFREDNYFYRRSVAMVETPCELLVPDTVSILVFWNGDPALLIGVISALRIPPLEY